MGCEWLGIFRISQIFFYPRGSSYLSVSGGDISSKTTFIVCVGVDSSPGDVTYHPEPFLAWLRPLHWQSLTPASLLLALACFLAGICGWLVWADHVFVRWLLLVGMVGCGLMVLLFWWTSQKPVNEQSRSLAIRSACQIIEKLEVLGVKNKDFYARWQVLFLGAATQGWAMESWIRQHRHEYDPSCTFVIELAPTPSMAQEFFYRTHEGIMRRVPMDARLISAAESVACRFQQQHKMLLIPSPQRRFGSSLSWVAHQQGYPALVIGGLFKTSESKSVGDVEGRLADWCVAVVLSLASSLHSESLSQESLDEVKTKLS